jgi:outer membrane lipoprotein SlyB
MKHKIITLIALTTVSISLTGCSPRIGGNDYALGGVGEIGTTLRGVIINARNVNVSSSTTTEGDNKAGLGAATGAVAGAVAGSQIGKGRGSAIAGVVGALAGGVAGHYIERGLTDQTGIEYQIQLDNGSIVTVVQGPDPKLSVGQRVMVIKSNRDRSRVVADRAY